jgi:hypothetical protein
MTYALTVNAGVANFVTPDGQRRKAGDQFTLTDAEYGRLTAGAKAMLTAGPGGTATGSLGGSVSHQVTVAAGLTNVVLPDGLRHKGGDVVVLSDQEYSTIPASAKVGGSAAVLSADTTTLT